MSFWTAGLCGITVCFSGSLAANVGHAQDLAPRAYVITPIHSNAITLTYSFFDGSLVFEGTIPITGAQARVNVTIFNYSHSLKLFGRTANFTGSLPYGIGHLRGTVVGAEALAYRSGLLPASVRFSVNLVGGPAMNVAEYTKWRQRTIVGISLRLVPKTGQYDPTKLINFGTNRWAFKPELGFSERWGHWILDAYRIQCPQRSEKPSSGLKAQRLVPKLISFVGSYWPVFGTSLRLMPTIVLCRHFVYSATFIAGPPTRFTEKRTEAGRSPDRYARASAPTTVPRKCPMP